MRTKLLGRLVFGLSLLLVVCEPLIQPLYQGQLTNDQHRNQVPAASFLWVTEALSTDDSKTTTALCCERSSDAACAYSRDAGCGRLAAQSGAVPKVVNIHKLVCVYLI